MTLKPMTIRISDETRKKMKIFAATHDVQMQDFYEAFARHILMLPDEEVLKILKK